MSSELTAEDLEIIAQVDAEIAAMSPEEVEREGKIAAGKFIVFLSKKNQKLNAEIKVLQEESESLRKAVNHWKNNRLTEIERLKHPWISVDNPPEAKGDYFVLLNNKGVHKAFFKDDYWSIGVDILSNVTDYMPIPNKE